MTREVPVGEWKPTHPGFDYLALIEKDKQKQKQEHDRLNIIPSTDTEKKQTGKHYNHYANCVRMLTGVVL